MHPRLTLLIVAGTLLAAPTAHAQPATPLYHRVLQINALAAPAADAATTLWSNQWANLVETNPLVRRSDGSADPVRTIALKGSCAALSLVLLRLVRADDRFEARWPRIVGYATVIALNGLEWRAAWRNARLPRTTRR